MKIFDKYIFVKKISTVLTVLSFLTIVLYGLSATASTPLKNICYHGVTGFAVAPNVDFGPYMTRMQDKIKSNWAPPAVDINAQIVVKYRILKNGSLESYGISSSSGSQELDNAAIEALKKAAPFEPLPEGFNKESILVQFTFDYQKPNNQSSNQNYQGETRNSQQNSNRQIQTLAISPLGNAQASTVPQSQKQVVQQAQPQIRQQVQQPVRQAVQQPQQTIRQNQQVITQQNTNQQPLIVQQPTPTNGIRMQNSQNAYTQAIPVQTNSQTGTIAVGTPPVVRQQHTPTTNTQERAIAYSQPITKQPVVSTPQRVQPTNVPTVIDNQIYTTAPALAEPSVNPRRTVDIDTFAEPEQLPLTIPITPESEQISKPVLRTQTPMNSQEINRVALPVKYDPEIEKVVVDEDELPPIETPTLSTGVSKVAIPQRRQRVKQQVYAPPAQTPAPTYVTAPPKTVYTQPQPPVVAPVKVPDLSAYMAKVQRKITKKWHPPLSDYSTKVVVNYIIKKNGDLGKYYVTESSGNSRMDVSAMEALKKAAPFDPLPSGYNEDTLEVKFTFDYNVYKNKMEKEGIKDLESDDEDI